MNVQPMVSSSSVKSAIVTHRLPQNWTLLWWCGIGLLIVLLTWQNLAQLTSDLCYLTARRLSTVGHVQGALWLLQQAEHLQTDQPLTYNLAGYILYTAEDLAASQKQLEAGVQYSNVDATLLNNLAVLHHEQQADAQALTFQQQAAAATTTAVPYYNLGILSWQNRDPVAALRAMREATRIEPTWSAPYLYLSWIYLTQENYALAEQNAQKAVTLQPDQASGYELYIQALLAQQKGALVLEIIQSLPKHRLQRDHLRLYEAFALRMIGKRAEAVHLLEKLFRWSPDSFLRYRAAIELRAIYQR